MTTNIAHVIGVDIGTTSTKAVVFDVDGKVKGHKTVDYPLYTPGPGVAEQDPREIFAATLGAIRGAVAAAGVTAADVRAVGFSAAMHSVIAVDAEGRPLTASITWADSRSSAYARRINEEMDGLQVYLRTGTPIHPMSPLAKLMWLHNDRPEVFRSAARFVGIKEYVFFRLFGQWLVDFSIASATGLFNLRNLDWDAGALAIAGITADRLSLPVPPTHHLEGLDPALAVEMGLSPDVPFVLGGNDGVLSNLGVNAIQPGEVAITIGTSGAMRAVVDRPLTDPSGRTFCYLLTPNHWVIGGPVNNGGIAFRWVRDELAAAETETAKRLGIDPYDVLTRIAERVPPGSEGLIFHPYLTGERAPWWNASMRASFFGLAACHHKEHMVRAVLEGVIYSLFSILPAVEGLIGQTRTMKATGGFARSGLWRQMMADVFDREVVVPESFESSCLGAAIIALYALGIVDSISVVEKMVGATHRHLPIPENVAVYAELMPIYLSVAGKLTDEYARIARFQRGVRTIRAASEPATQSP
ncbi:MAG: gluconokinase [Rhodospirillales bacterium]